MFQNIDVKRVLEKYIKQGFSKFAIYPFGDNGVLIKNILWDYFGIEPVYIIDNKYSVYHPNIISLEEMVAIDDFSCFILLTIEDWQLNWKMEEQCLKYFGRSRLINVKKSIVGEGIVVSKYLTGEYCRKTFAISNFFDFLVEKNPDENKEKIKVRIFHHGARVWNAYETVCSAFKKDARFDVLLILYHAEDFNEVKQQAIAEGISYIEWGEYKPSIDLPDIFIYTTPFFARFVKNVCNVAKVSFIIPLTLMVYSSDQKRGAEQTISEIKKSGVDYCLAERQLYNSLSQESDVRILEFGNPKFDVLYRLSIKKKISKKFEKLANKQVILYSTTHGNRNGGFMEGITFDLYAKFIFEFVSDNPEIGLIFRPHPMFITELVNNNYWTEEGVIKVRKYMDSTENMVWDDNDTYEDALVITDAIITDGYCGMTLSTLPLMKPICALYRNQEIPSMCPEIDECLYVVRSEKALMDFLIKVIMEGQDRMLEDRKMACNNFIQHFDGKNGQRIKDFITDVYLNL